MQTGDDVRRFIEENLFAVWMQGSMDGATASNEPWPQRGLVKIAEMLNYRRGTDFMDWLYDGNGNMRIFLPNGYFRDGAPYESTGGYNSAHVDGVGPIIQSIEHLRELNPDLYPEGRYPNLGRARRYRQIFDFSMDTVNIGRTFPKVGDGGSFPKFEVLEPITRQNGDLASFEHVYTHHPRPQVRLGAGQGQRTGSRPPASPTAARRSSARRPSCPTTGTTAAPSRTGTAWPCSGAARAITGARCG